MPELPISTDSLDSIPEAVRDSYVDRTTLPESDPRTRAPGKYVVQLGGEGHEGWNVSNYASLKSGLDRKTEEARGLKGKLDSYNGFSPEQIEEMKAVYDERKDWSKPGTELSKAREEIKREFESELGRTKQQAQEAAARANAKWSEAEILRAAARNGVLVEEIDVYLPYLREQVFEQVTLDDGSTVLRGRGDEFRFSSKEGETGVYANPDQIFQKLKGMPRFGGMFQGHGKSGAGSEGAGGAPGGNQTHSGPNPFHKATASLADAISIKQTNPPLAARLISEAGSDVHPAFASTS